MPQNQPAGTNDYVYAGKIQQLEEAAIEEADSQATGDISDPIVRDLIPKLDFNAGADTNWSGDAEGFEVSPTADGPGTFEVYEIDSDTGRADDRTFAIYGFEIVEGGEYVERVEFSASDGQTFERAQLSGLEESGDTQIDRQKTLRSPISFGPQENGSVELVVNDEYGYGNDTAGEPDNEIVLKLLAVTAEKTGRRVGTRQ